MSIAQLKKVSLVGPVDQKRATLARLQDIGCMHILPLTPQRKEPEKVPTRGADDAYKALRFLAAVEGQRRQLSRDDGFRVQAFIDRVLDLKQSMRDVRDRRDFLENRLAVLEPWGDLVFPDPDQLGGVLLWFYELPANEGQSLDALEVPWQIIAQDQRTLYVALASPTEPDPDLLPVERVHIGNKPRHVLLHELEDAEIELESLRAERIALTRYLSLFRSHISEAETEAELAYALELTHDDDSLFAVQGWVPEDDLATLGDLAERAGLAIMIEDPAWNESPPTRLVQPEKEAAGVDLAMFYQVPSYRSWDPTVLLIASFAVFFAMIVADAGYGLVILLGLILGWNRLGTTATLIAWRRLGLIIAGSTIAYGIIVGSYFGVAPQEDTVLSALAFLDLNDFDTMMRLSILIGVAHIVFAIGMNALTNRHRRSSRAQLGWIAAIVGGLLFWLSGQSGPTSNIGIALLVIGLLTIVVFTSERPIEKPLDWALRAFDGIAALNGVMGAFGDVLSYMRLFALGLASASLALTFNDLAGQVRDAVPGLGLLLGILILAVGHLLNFGLAMMSGVVHGLRLNYIEFFKWGLPEEGFAFRPLTRKEVQE